MIEIAQDTLDLLKGNWITSLIDRHSKGERMTSVSFWQNGRLVADYCESLHTPKCYDDFIDKALKAAPTQNYTYEIYVVYDDDHYFVERKYMGIAGGKNAVELKA